jgi:hypothetical protein
MVQMVTQTCHLLGSVHWRARLTQALNLGIILSKCRCFWIFQAWLLLHAPDLSINSPYFSDAAYVSMIYIKTSDNFPTLHQTFGLGSGDEQCLLWDTKWILKLIHLTYNGRSGLTDLPVCYDLLVPPTLPPLSRLTHSLPQITRLATEGSISNECHLDIYRFAAVVFNQLSTMNACRWHLCYWQVNAQNARREGDRAILKSIIQWNRTRLQSKAGSPITL